MILILILPLPFLSSPLRESFSYQVKDHNGTPTLFIDGKPVFYATWWLPAPEVEGWARAEFARNNAAETGVHIYAFDVGRLEWTGPGKDRTSHFDFSTVEARLHQILREDPQARFHFRIYFEMNERMRQWWHDMYPEEVEITSDGSRYRQSFASCIWREQVKDFLRSYISHLQKIGLDDRVIAYQVGAGHTGEWVKGKTSMYYLTGDYSRPMQRHFRAWLQDHYQNDAAALRKAWNDPEVDFTTAEVPSGDEQFQTRHGVFRDPDEEQNVIDYYVCLADLCSDLILDFCKTIKDATGGRSLAGAFYGYLMELAWNAGFFSEGPDSPFSTYQRSGHLGLAKVLNSPLVDFLVSPYSYGFRGIGGEGCSMLPSESLRIHNKIYLYEDDTRSHTHDHPAYGRARDLRESTAILKRNLAYIATHGHGVWWLINEGHMDPTYEPAFKPLLKFFQKLGTFIQSTDRAPSAEVAVLLDDESFFYETVKNELNFPLIFKQRLVGLPRMGAPFDVYLLNDFLEGRLRPYKLYIFLNPFRLDENRRSALKRELRREGKTALWIYAPGYIKERPAVENIQDLTGFIFAKHDRPWPSYIHITNFTYPLTKNLSQDLTWGTDSLLAPLFHVEDPEAVELGQVVYSQGRCRVGYALKEFPEWNSIFSSVPNLPAPVLREIARFAGVHLYSDRGDVLYATSELLAVHTLSGGKRRFVLPERVEVVYDLFDQKLVAEGIRSFEVELEPVSTVMYFTGKRERLQRLPYRPCEAAIR
jgi:hypothetical protein